MIIWIEILKDNTIWIQYRSSYIFYNIQDCISDSTLCTQCTQSYYFNNTKLFNSNGMYGQGFLDNPYTTSSNFFTSVIKAQYYKELIGGVTNMNVGVMITPDKMMYLSKTLISFDFASIISISFMSSYFEKPAQILYIGEFILQNYNSVIFENIQIYYGFDSDNQECGLSFINIKNGVTINNLQSLPQFQSKQNCYKIKLDKSEIQINNYVINQQIFNDKDFIISTINTNKINISNLKISNCQLNEQFSILKQQTNIEATIKSVYLIDNTCINTFSDAQHTFSLFTAGLFRVSDIYIKGNIFCNKNIFTTITMLEHTNQDFQFKDIEITDNIFYTKSTYIFLNILYAMIQTPDHSLSITNIKLKNNKLKQELQNNSYTSSFVQTNKIAKLKFEQIYLEDHFDIQFGLFEISSDININEFYCMNSEIYQLQFNNQITSNCIQINESRKVSINKIRIVRKNVLDKPLFLMTNYLVEQATLQINDGEFKNLILNQTKTNSYTSPVYVRSSYSIIFYMENCHFENNNLQNIQFSLTYSTTGLWVENFVGQVIIKKSSFKNCYSDSKYNFMYIQSNILEIDTVLLQKSSFLYLNESNSQNKALFIQEGGVMNIKVNTLTMIDSEFSQSTALKGSFLLVQSFGEILKINIKNSTFSEGYSSIDGGAFYIDTIGSILKFNCEECYFNKIYTLFTLNSAISFEQIKILFNKYVKLLMKCTQYLLIDIIKLIFFGILYKKYVQSKSSELNQISFQGGSIKNIHGILENYFIYAENSYLNFSNISKITSEEFISDNLALSFYIQKKNKQQSTFVNLINSVIELQDCSFTQLSIKNKQSLSPLLLNSYNSSIYFKQSSIEKIIFQTSLLNAINSNLTIQETKFINIQQNLEERSLQEISQLMPTNQASSLFILQNIYLKVYQLSLFQNISCLNNCNGGVFQIIDGNIDIEQIEISNTESTFGGAMFIYGIHGNNKIKSTNFNECKSKVDGGAMYIKSLSADKYNFIIDKCKYTKNNALNYGGALFIRSEAQNSIEQTINIQNTEFTGNSAKIGGAINQQNISPIVESNSKFENNIGELYGSDIYSYPQQLYLVNLKQIQNEFKTDIVNNQLKIIDLRSGDIIKNLSFQFLDEKNKTIKPIISSDQEQLKIYLRINPETVNIINYDIRGDLIASYNPSTGYFTFNNITIVGKPKTSVILEAKSDQIYILNKSTNKYEQNYSFKIQIDFRSCINGEQIKEYNQFIECSICEIGQFSYDIKQCFDCPLGATCNGGFNLITNNGFWRKTIESDLVIECSNLLENCVGGSFGDNICFEGHIGALCEECDIYGEVWGHSYSKQSNYLCSRCDQIKNNIWRVILVVLWAQISMSLAIKGGVNNLKQKIAVQKIQNSIRKKQSSISSQSGIRSSGISLIRSKTNSQSSSMGIELENQITYKDDQSGIYIKMFTNYMQIVGSISTFNLKIPIGILDFPKSVGQPLQESMNSLDCALQQLDLPIPIIYLRLIFSIIIPLIYLVIFFTAVVVYHFYKKHQQFPWYFLSTATIFLIIYVQPDLVAQVISSLSCRMIGDTQYILSNVSFECNTNEHRQYIYLLIIPLLILWVFILPFILFLILRNKREQLDSKEIKLKYGFIYKEYKYQAFYWEFIKMAEKIAIILSLNFYSQNIIIKGILVLMIISTYGILSLIIKPYKDEVVNQVDSNSTYVCAITVLLGIFIYNNPYSYFIYLSISLMVIINLWFICKILKKIIAEYIPKLKLCIMPLLNKLSSKISYIGVIIQKLKREKRQRKFNPIIKKKMRKLFQVYLNMSPNEKRKFIMKIIEFKLSKIEFFNFIKYKQYFQQIVQSYGNTFKDNNEENVQQSIDELNSVHKKQMVIKSLKLVKDTSEQNYLNSEELKLDFGTWNIFFISYQQKAPQRDYDNIFSKQITLESSNNIYSLKQSTLSEQTPTYKINTINGVITEEQEEYSMKNIN